MQGILLIGKGGDLCAFVRSASQRGFLVTTEQPRVVARELGRKLCKPFKQGRPGKDWVRGFWSVHRDLVFRNFEKLKLTKHDAFHPDHVETYETVLEKLQNDHPGILRRLSVY